ncbi:MAG TPA: hypothetical protein VMW64_01045 [Dehalococcoidia bacterium]|nr:hypothetical protein [Dehalococcoidia bacterium]
MYDRYQHWSTPDVRIPLCPARSRSIEDQVLKDLAAAKDDMEKVEILDSYAAYAERVYRGNVASALAQQAGDVFSSFLVQYLMSQLPSVFPPHRGGMARQTEQ